MAKIKSVVLNKTAIDNGYIVEFYNPFWGRFVIECKFEKESHSDNNMFRLMRVGDYFLIKGKPNGKFSIDIREFSIVKYMRQKTEAVRKSGRELIITNMSVREMNNLADNILDMLNQYKKQEFADIQNEQQNLLGRIKQKVIGWCK